MITIEFLELVHNLAHMASLGRIKNPVIKIKDSNHWEYWKRQDGPFVAVYTSKFPTTVIYTNKIVTMYGEIKLKVV